MNLAVIVMTAVFVVAMAFVLGYVMPAVICSVRAYLMQYAPASLRSFACFIFVDLFGKATSSYLCESGMVHAIFNVRSSQPLSNSLN